MSQRPPRSTLFPYAALFRSVHREDGGPVGDLLARGTGHRGPCAAEVGVTQPTGHRAVEGVRRDPDRKSTRLNSSHANISYAVFCLKKTNPLALLSGARFSLP